MTKSASEIGRKTRAAKAKAREVPKITYPVPEKYGEEYRLTLAYCQTLPEWNAAKSGLLAQLFMHRALFDKAMEAVNSHGVMIEAADGKMTQNPAVMVANASSDRVASISGLLGLAQKPRRQVQPEPEDNGDNPW